jgi:hypothetical protein
VFVHSDGNVIFDAARCCSKSSFLALNRNTLNARWSIPRGCPGLNLCAAYLLSCPKIASFSS